MAEAPTPSSSSTTTSPPPPSSSTTSPTPSSSTTFADIPLDDNKTSKILAENPSPPSDSNSPQESPPSDGKSPPSPDSSSQNPTPPPSDSSSSPSPPTTDSNTPSKDSPPPDSNSSPPSDSGESSPSPPPPPSDNSNSDSSPPPPPPDSGSSNSSPPSDSQSSPPPPPPSDSNSNSPPPKDDTPSPPAPPPDSTVAKPPPNDQSSSSPSPDKSSSPPKSPPKESSPPPKESKASPPSAPTHPLAPLPKTPVTPNSPPHSHDSPPAPTTSVNRSPPADDNTPSVPTPPGSKSPQHVPELTPPSRNSDSSSYTPSSRSGGSSTGGVAGATLAGIVIIAFVAIFFVVVRKKKKRANAYPGYFGPPPPNYSGSADGYYYAQHSQQHSLPNSQQYAIGIAGQSNEFYSGPKTMGNGHGSYRAPESGVMAGGLSCFSYEELMGITSGFARQNIIGEGGFGSVYKGFLTDGRAVAVKELKAGSGQGEREFRAEVEIISRVHHRHLVSLVGYCIADSHRLLVYEFVSNNTLEHHLHGEGVPVMEWSKRVKIAVGSARGLAYLHEDCHPKIIHRDIKSANILIDDDYEAQVADFGLAKLSDDISAHVSTRVMGTFGYLAPEYAASGKLSDKSDVFSFGVVLLEIVTGRKPVDGSQPLGDESLVEWARPLLTQALETGDFSELVDPRLGNRYVEDEMLRMITAASASVRHSAPKRPRMVQVLRALDTEGDMPDITNGVKVGQSTIFQAGQNVSDMQKFRMMAFGSEDSSEYQMQSSEYQMKTGNFTSGEVPRRPRPGDTGAVEFSSGELETRAINPRSNRRL